MVFVPPGVGGNHCPWGGGGGMDMGGGEHIPSWAVVNFQCSGVGIVPAKILGPSEGGAG